MLALFGSLVVLVTFPWTTAAATSFPILEPSVYRPHFIRRVPSAPRKGHSTIPSFMPMSIVATVAHLSYCWALVTINICCFISKFNFKGPSSPVRICLILKWVICAILWVMCAILYFGCVSLCRFFNGRTVQIWSKSVEPLSRYGDFSIFKDGGRRHLGFLNFWNFNGRNAHEGQTASPCQIWSKSVKPYMAIFSIFPRWRLSANLLCACLDTNEEYLVVFIAVQNLVGIGVVILKIPEFQWYRYATLAWKCLFAPLLGKFFLGEK